MVKKLTKSYDPNTLSYGKYMFAQFIHYASVGIYGGGYLSALYIDKGVEMGMVGVIASLSTASGIFGNLISGRLCDKLNGRKVVYLLCSVINFASLTALFFSQSVYLLILFGMLAAFAYSPMPAIMDSWLLASLGKHGSLYGTIRLFGSIGYCVAVFIYGRLIGRFGWSVMPWALLVMAAIIIPVFLFTKEEYPKDESESNAKDESAAVKPKTSLKLLFKNPIYVVFVLAICVLMLTTTAYYTYLPLLVTQAGGDTGILGTVNMLHALGEIPVFLLLSLLLRKWPARSLMAVSLSAYLLRFSLLPFIHSIPMLYLVVPLQGISYGFYLPCFRMIISSLAPKGMQTSAQTTAEAISGSLMGVLSGVLAGAVVSRLGYTAMLYCCIGLNVLVLVLYLTVVLPKLKRYNV